MASGSYPPSPLWHGRPNSLTTQTSLSSASLYPPVSESLNPRQTCPRPSWATLGSGQLGVLDRELANAFARGGEQRVTDRRDRRRHTRLAHPDRQVVARQEIHMRFIRRLVDPRHR